MGNSYHVHIGGYAEVEFPSKVRTRKVMKCPTCNQKRLDSNSKFCDVCGGQYGETTENYRVVLSLEDLMGDEYNNLITIYPEEHGGDYVILISNYVGDNISLNGNPLVKVLTNYKIKEIFNQFRNKFVHDFDTLREKGAKITLHYGVIAYWS